jgi:hypothetical protein
MHRVVKACLAAVSNSYLRLFLLACILLPPLALMAQVAARYFGKLFNIDPGQLVGFLVLGIPLLVMGIAGLLYERLRR